MGAATSSEPRSVSMDNPNPASVIDVSDEVVLRLKKGITKQVKDNTTAAYVASSTPLEQQKPQQQQETRAIPVKPAPPQQAAAAPAPRPPTVVYPSPATVYVQAPAAASAGITMTALEMRRQKEIELQQNDVMWRQRMTQLEQTLNKTNAVMEKEYSTAVEDVRKRFATAAPAHQLPPCQDLKAQLIACYRAHPYETLKCAEEVAMFRNCVSVNRVKKLDEEDPKKLVVTPLDAAKTKPAKAA